MILYTLTSVSPSANPPCCVGNGQIYSDAGRRMAIVDRDVVKDLIKRGCTGGVAQRATGKYYPGSGINDFDELAIEFYKLLNLGPARKLIGGIGLRPKSRYGKQGLP